MARGVYATQEDAAIAGLTSCFLISIEEAREWGGKIFRVPTDGGYNYTDPIPGNMDHFFLDWVVVPPNVEEVGFYHTHGDFTTGSHLQGTLERVPRGESDYSPRGLGVNGRDGDFWSVDDIVRTKYEAHGRPGYRGYLGTAAMMIRFYDPHTGEEDAIFPREPVRLQRP